MDIGGFSKELCGGTHVKATGEIGLLKIVSESAIAAGTRRIEAIVGPKAYQLVNDMQTTISKLSEDLSAPDKEIITKVESLLARNAELEKRMKGFEQKAAGNIADELAAQATSRGGLKVVKAVVSAENPNALRQLGANLLGKLGEGVAILGAEINGKASVVAFASPKAISEGHKAGDIIRSITAKVDGKGGGKPDFAMGGGANPAALKQTIDILRLSDPSIVDGLSPFSCSDLSIKRGRPSAKLQRAFPVAAVKWIIDFIVLNSFFRNVIESGRMWGYFLVDFLSRKILSDQRYIHVNIAQVVS